MSGIKRIASTLNYAKAEDDLSRRHTLLDELGALARPYPIKPRTAVRFLGAGRESRALKVCLATSRRPHPVPRPA
jgi:hypothetical protein